MYELHVYTIVLLFLRSISKNHTSKSHYVYAVNIVVVKGRLFLFFFPLIHTSLSVFLSVYLSNLSSSLPPSIISRGCIPFSRIWYGNLIDEEVSVACFKIHPTIFVKRLGKTIKTSWNPVSGQRLKCCAFMIWGCSANHYTMTFTSDLKRQYIKPTKLE